MTFHHLFTLSCSIPAVPFLIKRSLSRLTLLVLSLYPHLDEMFPTCHHLGRLCRHAQRLVTGLRTTARQTPSHVVKRRIPSLNPSQGGHQAFAVLVASIWNKFRGLHRVPRRQRGGHPSAPLPINTLYCFFNCLILMYQ